MEDRTRFGEGFVEWTDLAWGDWRLERGTTMDEKEWALFFQGRALPQDPDERGVCFVTVRSIRSAKNEILDRMED